MEIVGKDKCFGCAACYSCCPVDAIRMKEDEEGFRYPEIDGIRCIKCGKCRKVCPVLCRNEVVKKENNCYAVINKDNSIRMQSSSGGVFDLLANKILEENGLVYGVAFNEEHGAFVLGIRTNSELNRLRGSKYVQANVGDAYREIQQNLKEGRKVLFVGTPCQVAGLKNYLGKDYENLVLVDLICHGTPSNKVFQQYLCELESKYKSNAISICFREKSFGWNRFAMRIEFANGRYYHKPNQLDPWMLAFNENIMLRTSCYNCQFRVRDRVSDLTLGDLWGIDNVAREMNDNKGVSFVVIQSDKGKQLIRELAEAVWIKSVDFSKVKDSNSFHTLPIHESREAFIKTVIHDSFRTAYKEYVAKPYRELVFLNLRLTLSNLKQKAKRRLKL